MPFRTGSAPGCCMGPHLDLDAQRAISCEPSSKLRYCRAGLGEMPSSPRSTFARYDAGDLPAFGKAIRAGRLPNPRPRLPKHPPPLPMTDAWTDGTLAAYVSAAGHLKGGVSMHGFNGYALGAGNSQPVAQPSPVSSLDPNLYGRAAVARDVAARRPSPWWEPSGAIGVRTAASGHLRRWPRAARHGGAARARPKNAALSVTSMICGIAGVVLGVGAQVPLMLVIVEFNQWPRCIIGTLSVAGTVADGGTVLLGVVGLITGVLVDPDQTIRWQEARRVDGDHRHKHRRVSS